MASYCIEWLYFVASLGFIDDSDRALSSFPSGRRASESEEALQGRVARSFSSVDSGIGEANVLQAPDSNDIYRKDNVRKGPGEMGEAVDIAKEMLGQEERKIYDVGFKRNSFNQYASDMISVKRSLPDMRSKECKAKVYRHDLPDTSVIVCFHNEAWSTLIRSVHSILDRTPARLLKEIVLVDDASDLGKCQAMLESLAHHLKDKLEKYVAKYAKIKIIRSKERVGLIKARLLGYEAAIGTVLTFLDSHIECTKGWLEPLLDRIATDRSNVVWPVIDIISLSTLAFKRDKVAAANVGGFDWGLTFDWHRIPKRVNASRPDPWSPVPSPTMAGGLFSIDRSYFKHLGAYDPDFDIWGGENLEISFKTWMCGGTLEMIPCSHVGHIFREVSPYKWREGKDALRKNLVRLAEVWLDDYKKYYYERIDHNLGDYGDISERVALRKRLNCSSFDWYIKNVFPEIFIPDKVPAWGEIRNEAENGRYCMDGVEEKHSNKTIDVYPCHGQGGNQYWSYSNDSEIRRDDQCVDYSGKRIKFYPCHTQGGNQLWLHDRETGAIRHPDSEQCLEMDIAALSIITAPCDENKLEQRWKFGHYSNSTDYSSTTTEESS